MRSDLKLFGAAHLLILVSIPLVAAGLAVGCRRSGTAGQFIRWGLAGSLALIELVWYIYVLRVEGFRFPNGLALDLCDVTLWVTVLAAFTLKPWACEIVYYTALAGSGMALLTPDLWTPGWSYPIISFFLAHGITVVTVLTLAWGKLSTPRPGSVWRVLGIVNVYAVAVGLFDAIFKTNYMYLRQKPAGSSLLDYFGPWPVYLLGGELIALALFWLLWLPFSDVAPVEDAVNANTQ